MEVSGQLHAPTALTQRKAPGTHWIGGWVGPRAVLDALVKKKLLITDANLLLLVLTLLEPSVLLLQKLTISKDIIFLRI
jgi:hypothetical protein